MEARRRLSAGLMGVAVAFLLVGIFTDNTTAYLGVFWPVWVCSMLSMWLWRIETKRQREKLDEDMQELITNVKALFK